MILFVLQIILQSLSTVIAAWHLFRSRSIFWGFIGAASSLMVARRLTAFMVIEHPTLVMIDRLYLPLTISAFVLLATVSAVYIEKEKDRLRQIERDEFKYSSSGRGHVALDGTILEVNDALCDIWELSREEIMSPSFTWQKITPEPDLSIDLANLSRLVTGQSDSYTMEKRYLRPGNPKQKYKYVQLTVWRVHRSDGSISHFSINVVDYGFARAVTRSLEALDESIRGLDE